MPVSTSVHLSHCAQVIMQLNPASVLDVGCGFGVWGFLCREYLDVMKERVQPDQWRVRIDGLEVFEPYIQAHQRALYDEIIVSDIRDALPNLGSYDLIIVGDMIEHLDKEDGSDVLEALYEKAEKALLVNVPIGPGWDHPESHGNPAELHRSEWAVEDFVQYPHHQMMFSLPCGDYGVFCCLKDCTQEQRVAGLFAAAELCDGRGQSARAIRHLQKSLAIEPNHRESVCLLADVLLRQGQMGEAVDALAAAIQADPTFHVASLFAARILVAGNRADAARSYITAVLERDDVPSELRAEAERLDQSIGSG